MFRPSCFLEDDQQSRCTTANTHWNVCVCVCVCRRGLLHRDWSHRLRGHRPTAAPVRRRHLPAHHVSDGPPYHRWKPVYGRVLFNSIPDCVCCAVLLKLCSYYNYTTGLTNNIQWLAFQASLPPVGFAAYFVTPASTVEEAPSTFASTVTEVSVGAADSTDSTITNGVLSLTFSAATGLLSSYANTAGGVSTPLTQSLWYYYSYPGTQKDGQARCVVVIAICVECADGWPSQVRYF